MAQQEHHAHLPGKVVDELSHSGHLRHSDNWANAAGKVKLGDRCRVSPGGRTGTVRYVGPIPEIKEGFWVGVEYDGPTGKCDGTAGHGDHVKRYFECQPNHGVFTRPDLVVVLEKGEEDED